MMTDCAKPPRQLTAGTTKSRVLVVEGLPLAGLGLRALLDGSRDLVSCGSTGNITVAVAAIQEVRPDVVLVDSALDAGAVGTRAMLAAQAGIGLVALVRDGVEAGPYVRAARKAGVRGLVPRSASPAAIVAAVRTVRMGGQVLDARLGPLLAGRPVPIPEQKVLSARQASVLELIATGRGNAEIAEALGVSIETIRSHVKAILLRMDARDRAHAVARGYQTGLLGAPRRPALAVVGTP